jgi:hypothetical protein
MVFRPIRLNWMTDSQIVLPSPNRCFRDADYSSTDDTCLQYVYRAFVGATTEVLVGIGQTVVVVVKQIRQGYCQYQDQQRCCQKPRSMFTGDVHERSDNHGQKRIVPCQGETQPSLRSIGDKVLSEMNAAKAPLVWQ